MSDRVFRGGVLICRRFDFVLVVVAMIAAISVLPGFTRQTHAQSQLLISEPLSVRELDRYAQLLELSPEQRVALDDAHLTYRSEFEKLESGPIAELRELMSKMSGGVPDAKLFRSFLRQRGDVQTKIAALDQKFIDGLAASLDSTQEAVLPRIRLARKRTAASSDQLVQQMSGGEPADLLWITLPTLKDLPLDQRDAADAILQTWERSSTPDFTTLQESSTAFLRAIMDAFKGTRFEDMDQQDLMQDPEAVGELMQLMQNAFKEAGKEAREVSTDMRERTTASMKQLASVLPPSAGWRIYRGVFEKSYSQYLWSFSSAPSAPQFVAWLERSDIEPEMRAKISDAFTGVWQQERAVLDSMIDDVNEFLEDYDPMQMAMAMQGGDDDDVINPWEFAQELQEEHSDMGASGLAILAEITGDPTGPFGIIVNENAREFGPTTAPMASEDDLDDMRSGRNMGAVSRLSRREFRTILKTAGVSGDDESRMLEEFKTFAEEFDADSPVQKYTDAQSSMWGRDPESGQMTGPTRESIDRVTSARRDATRLSSEQNARLLDRLEATIEDESMRIRFRAARKRVDWQRLADTCNMMGWALGGEIPAMPQIIDDAIGETYDTVELIAEYVDSTRAIMTKLHDHVVKTTDYQFELQLATDDDPERAMAAQVERGQRFAAIRSDAMEMRNQLIAKNTDWIVSLDERLGGELVGALQRGLREAAYPRVYNDPIAMTRVLSNALKLDDLSETQREQVIEILSEYRPAYDALCERAVVALGRSAKAMNMTTQGEREDIMEVVAELEKVSFERNELSLRAANRLRAALREDQIARAGGIPNPDQATKLNPWG